MRPKKTVLCVGANDDRLGRQAFLLETRGYRTLRASSTAQALKMLELLAAPPLPCAVDAMVLQLPLLAVEETLRAANRICAEMKTVLVRERDAMVEQASLADIVLPHRDDDPEHLLEWVRLLCMRKRGPKRAEGSRRELRAKAGLKGVA